MTDGREEVTRLLKSACKKKMASSPTELDNHSKCLVFAHSNPQSTVEFMTFKGVLFGALMNHIRLLWVFWGFPLWLASITNFVSLNKQHSRWDCVMCYSPVIVSKFVCYFNQCEHKSSLPKQWESKKPLWVDQWSSRWHLDGGGEKRTMTLTMSQWQWLMDWSG